MRFLELAAGKKRGSNWDGIRDIPRLGCRVYDLTKLPIEWIQDSTYDGVFSDHFIEHLEKEQGIALFKECMRILKPGGIVRTVWPPMEVVEWLQSEEDLSNNEFVKHYYQFYVLKHGFAPKEYKNHRIQEQVAQGLLWQKGEHKHLWRKSEMIEELEALGFEEAKECEYGKSRIAGFNSVDNPCKIRRAHSAVVEARKPWE